MAALLPYLEFELNAAEAVSIDRLAGWTVISVNGRIWLTEEKGGRDVWLLPGGRHRIVGAGRTVVETWPMTDAELPMRIRLAPPPGTLGRTWCLPKLRLGGAPACA
ncbi:DUF2917 domain-containing protein [Accumulibacter sp.]|uniref:DUF2917 domain-containing protein n=1 Tax=Accumulibacter sp. TaxID=2053492 RepID=UPI0026113F2F|nr:DUF2917 domain-containing protein [Accumulibacter sp.]